MIQDIAPRKYHVEFKKKRPEANDFLLIYRENEVLVKETGEEMSYPLVGEMEQSNPDICEKAEYLFAIDDICYFTAEEVEIPKEQGLQWKDGSVFREMEPGYHAFAGVTGKQFVSWKRKHRFCGVCGGPMEPSKRERAMVCRSCKNRSYPQICPAIIVAVTNEDKLLMTRYAKGNYKRYALVAGFTEVGETFEETVRREVMEEVGLKVKNIRYYKNQPWSFSDSQMIGFFAELDGDDTIKLQEEELSEALWVKREEIPDYSPAISVGQEMIMKFKVSGAQSR